MDDQEQAPRAKTAILAIVWGIIVAAAIFLGMLEIATPNGLF